MSSYRVAIVAKAPKAGDPADPTIEAFVANLAPHMPVLRAAHMDDVDQCLKVAWKDPARAGRALSLVLCGHGSSGILHLGSSWINPGGSLPMAAFSDPFYLIDTNPWALRRIGDHRDHFADITLVACNVGAVDAEGYAINGRTLAYTLCEHLNTDVIAAMDWVEPDELKTGAYVPKDHLLPSTWAWKKTAVPVYSDPNHGATPIVKTVPADPVRFRVVAVIGSRIPTPRSEHPGLAIEVQAHRVADPRLAHASAELHLRVVDGAGETHTAEMFGNGRALRIGSELYAIVDRAAVVRELAAALR